MLKNYKFLANIYLEESNTDLCNEVRMKKTSTSEKVSQDEIISNTKNVLRGLETLKSEHDGLLVKLSTKQRNGDHDGSSSKDATEKVDVIQKSLEKIELGIGEAQVRALFLILILVHCI